MTSKANYFLVKLRNVLGSVINPATSDNQTNGTQKTQIVDSSNTIWELEPNGGMPINIQDQTTEIVDVFFCNTLNAVTLAGTVTCCSRLKIFIY